jgi:hypothetical protein
MLEFYLQNYCNYEQDNWSEMLPMAEYDNNNTVTTSMGMSPVLANFGFDPRMNWPIEAEAKNLAYRNYVYCMTSVHALCRKSFMQARETMGKYHDRHAKEPSYYSVGDLVMVNGMKLQLNHQLGNWM